jgi:hypothetical protein
MSNRMTSKENTNKKLEIIKPKMLVISPDEHYPECWDKIAQAKAVADEAFKIAAQIPEQRKKKRIEPMEG